MASTAGSFAQSQIKSRRRSFRRTHRRKLVATALAAVALVAGLGVAFPNWMVPGWAAVGMLLSLTVVFVGPQIDGTYNLVAGRDAERWTSNDLRKMLGRGWHVVDGISFWHGDVDHIVVGPSGVFLVETKQTDSVFDLSRGFGRRSVEEWIVKIEQRQRSVRALLREHDVDVEPLIIVWGSEVKGLPLSFDGVGIIHRSNLARTVQRWKDSGVSLPGEKIEAIERALTAYRKMRDNYEADRTSP